MLINPVLNIHGRQTTVHDSSYFQWNEMWGVLIIPRQE